MKQNYSNDQPVSLIWNKKGLDVDQLFLSHLPADAAQRFGCDSKKRSNVLL